LGNNLNAVLRLIKVSAINKYVHGHGVAATIIVADNYRLRIIAQK